MIKIAPNTLKKKCPRCIWLRYNHKWSWPFRGAIYSRLAALEERHIFENIKAADVTGNPYTEWLWVKEKVVGAPFEGIDTHGRGPVFVGGEFDLVATSEAEVVEIGGIYVPDPDETSCDFCPSDRARDLAATTPANVVDCKTTLEPSEDTTKKWLEGELSGMDLVLERIGFGKHSGEEIREMMREDYIDGYLPQLAAYAYALEKPATDEFCEEFRNTKTVWPPLIARSSMRTRLLHEHVVDRVSILQFAVEKNIETHGDKFHFTAAPHYMERTLEDLGVESWEDFLRPKVQKICDIIVEPKPPPARKKCDDCQAAAEYNDLVSAP